SSRPEASRTSSVPAPVLAKVLFVSSISETLLALSTFPTMKYAPAARSDGIGTCTATPTLTPPGGMSLLTGTLTEPRSSPSPYVPLGERRKLTEKLLVTVVVPLLTSLNWAETFCPAEYACTPSESDPCK